MDEHIKRGIQLVETSKMILDSITFTQVQIDKLSSDLTEKELQLVISLMGKLKFDYMELKKLEREHDKLRKEVNTFYKREVMAPITPMEDLDFSV